LAIGLMVTLHAFWWFWLSPRAVEAAAPTRRGPSVRLLSGDYGRRIWTPTVLALPTEIGFSGTAMTNQFGEGPSIRMPRGPAYFLMHPAYDAAPTVSGEVWTRPPLVVRSPPPPEPAWEGEGEAPPPASPSADLLVQFAGRSIPDPEAEGLQIPAGFAAGNQPWRISIWIEFDDRQQVSHALVEESSGLPARDRALLQAVYRWRSRSAPAVPSGSVTIAYIPPDPGPTETLP
jgi:hypothetical protein